MSNGLGFRILRLGISESGTRLIALVVFLIGFMLSGVFDIRAEEKPSLAIIPFFVERAENPEKGAFCPVCKRVYRSGEILPGAQNTLTRLLWKKMEEMGRFKILPLEKVEKAVSGWEKRRFDEKPVASTLQLGKKLEADFILIGFLFHFEERIGSAIGAEKPAAVAFDVHLFRLKDEKMVWEGRFDETQRPLSENLLRIGAFFRRKASWLTAEELASVGMEEVLSHLPRVEELEKK
jgi:hypothetical protein